MHIVHCSIGRGYELAAAYRAQGHGATIEACIHYLTLDEENDVRRLGGKAKINPPLRPRREVEALWHHLAAGNVTVVSTDHVSWSEDRKTDPNMLKNASGVPGLEVLYRAADERPERAQSAADPCRAAAGAQSRGSVSDRRDKGRAGGRPRRRHRADAAAILIATAPRKAATISYPWSPYEGIELPFRAVATFLRGTCVAAEERVIARARSRAVSSGPLASALSGGERDAANLAARRRPPLGRRDGAGRNHRSRASLHAPLVHAAVSRRPRLARASASRKPGSTVRIDAAGNLIGRLEGKNPALGVIAIGSHSDTVPSGGRFDGIAGVAAGLEVVRALRDAGAQLDHTLEIIDFLAEEPSEYRAVLRRQPRHDAGRSLPTMLAMTGAGQANTCAMRCAGSAAIRTGSMKRGATTSRRFSNCTSSRARCSSRSRSTSASSPRSSASAALEIVFEGAADHAGTTPMTLRQRCAGRGRAHGRRCAPRLAEQLAAEGSDYFVATVGILDGRASAPRTSCRGDAGL